MWQGKRGLDYRSSGNGKGRARRETDDKPERSDRPDHGFRGTAGSPPASAVGPQLGEGGILIQRRADVDWFNSRRLLEPIGNIPPAEAEANFFAALETEAMAA